MTTDNIFAPWQKIAEQMSDPANPTWATTTASDLLTEERRDTQVAIETLCAERERYRAALARIAASRADEHLVNIARRALAGE